MYGRLGLAKIGVIAALTNNTIKKDQLLHTIKVSKSRAIIYGLELEDGTRRRAYFMFDQS